MSGVLFTDAHIFDESGAPLFPGGERIESVLCDMINAV